MRGIDRQGGAPSSTKKAGLVFRLKLHLSAGVLCFTPCVNARGYPLLAPHHLAGDLVAAFDALACPERGGGGCLPADVIAVR